MPFHFSVLELLLCVSKSPFLVPQLYMQISELRLELLDLRGGVVICNWGWLVLRRLVIIMIPCCLWHPRHIEIPRAPCGSS